MRAFALIVAGVASHRSFSQLPLPLPLPAVSAAVCLRFVIIDAHGLEFLIALLLLRLLLALCGPLHQQQQQQLHLR